MCVSLGKQQSGTQRSENPRRLRQIRQVEDDPGGDTEDSLEGIQVVKQTGGKLPPLKIRYSPVTTSHTCDLSRVVPRVI